MLLSWLDICVGHTVGLCSVNGFKAIGLKKRMIAIGEMLSLHMLTSKEWYRLKENDFHDLSCKAYCKT